MTKNTEQLEQTYQNGMNKLKGALKSKATLDKLGVTIYGILQETKKVAQEIVTHRTETIDIDKFDGNIGFEFLYHEVTEVDTIEKELRQNAGAKILLDKGFASEDALFEKKQNGTNKSTIISIETDEDEILSDF